ncbi:MAG: hypothetical protein WCJ63_04835 [Actinomycetes bacterium]
MTENRSTTGTQRKRPTPRKRIGPKPVFAVGVVTFVAFILVLGMQVAAGKDPSLGHGKQKTKVVHRKVKRIVITKVYDAPTVSDSGGAGGYSSNGYSSGGYSNSGSSGTYSGGSSGGSSSSSYTAPAPAYSPPAPTVSTGASGGG